jgi:outer membrane protein
MKKFLLILNAFLVVAVGVLFYLYFNYASSDIHKIKEANAAVANSFKIAYFDLDTLQSKYEDYKQVRDFLRGKDSEMTMELNRMQANYMEKVKEYQQKGASMSQADQSNYQQELAKMQDDYQQRQHDMSQEMNTVSMQKLQEVKSKIQDFLKDYCHDKGYAYVFASSNDDYLYYKDTLRNITDEVVNLLNAKSAQEKK